ncbi:TetR/AcrR family transcriptional regulator [Vibrio crassostreae]|uniref:TetR/AcrR family transcriptional regulator n=1 Tax=Vibrio crassostreae TaxID=246167 RepID=UPI00148C1418|nr:TetR/AcrR family transcriptional regulator [Vibrio crassostreae]NOI54884.1 TetR/AcrR family transcriptional regulator [Vibrio crassostreae]CAK2040663.1 TetR/AcrR family transcriptional regulator [Vibrio crassostreae]CAK2042967.1 TetR/AcrR family transcriptional regulator [Vibrio crassostreae]CAK2043761.1 TetR/AcrR family transcriptional regulator [Vibrio crassostreae]CAK2044695.1 TetR/AcrR family transcriptional regulator [Vibrio crassostreae]
MTKSKAMGRRSSEESFQTRALIVNNAYFLFSEKGYDNTSIREIAKLSNVTPNTIRHHFGSKSDIWMTIIQPSLALYKSQLELAFLRIEASRATPAIAFKYIIKTLVKTLTENSQIIRLVGVPRKTPNERELMVYEELKSVHVSMITLFNKAKKLDSSLKKYDSTTFFTALIGLVAAPLLCSSTMNKSNDHLFSQTYQSQIVAMLFND